MPRYSMPRKHVLTVQKMFNRLQNGGIVRMGSFDVLNFETASNVSNEEENINLKLLQFDCTIFTVHSVSLYFIPSWCWCFCFQHKQRMDGAFFSNRNYYLVAWVGSVYINLDDMQMIWSLVLGFGHLNFDRILLVWHERNHDNNLYWRYRWCNLIRNKLQITANIVVGR